MKLKKSLVLILAALGALGAFFLAWKLKRRD
jgi:hypothetical protein